MYMYIYLMYMYIYIPLMYMYMYYVRLQLKRGIDSLSDKLVLKIFSHLDPASLLKCRMVP